MIEQNYEIAEAFDINISPVGWYSTAILLRFETEEEEEKQDKQKDEITSS